MKIQLQGQTLRLRVNEDELAKLLAGCAVSNSTCLPSIGGSEQGVLLHDGTEATLMGSHASWSARLPRAAVQTYAGTLPARKGLDFTLAAAAPGGVTLLLVFDVDVRDSIRKRGAPQHDASSAAVGSMHRIE